MKKWILLPLIGVLLAAYILLAVKWYNALPGTEADTQPTAATTTATLPPETMPTFQAEEYPPAVMPEDYTLTARQAFVFDLGSGVMLYTFGEQDVPISPASITKLLTAYTALQYLDPGQVVTAGIEVTWIDPESSLALVKQGDRLTVELLIEGMMLQSGNDAAYTLAVALGQKILEDPAADPELALQAAMEAINFQARLLGMQETNFVTPDGDDEPGHYSTASDLLTLGMAVIQEPVILHYAGLVTDHVTFEDGKTLDWKNTNMLLHESSPYYCPEACGLKTGYTSLAGACQLSLFRTGGRYLLIGVFGSPTYQDRAADSLYLYEQYR